MHHPFTLTAERPDGERLTLTQQHSAYTVTYSGFGPVEAEIATSSMGTANGSKINSARRGGRNIVLTVYIRGNVEQNRIRLYSFFTPGHMVKLYYRNGTRDVYTEGVVESVPADQFAAVQTAQISILCESPYWAAAEEIVQDISNVVSAFRFPFAIAERGVPFSSIVSYDYVNMHNSGEESTGFIMTIFAREDVTAPVIYNAITNEALRVNGVLPKGHTMTINTIPGSKRITITDPAGVVTNAIHRKQTESTWLQLAAGDNYFAYAAEAGAESMLVTLRHRDLFVGV